MSTEETQETQETQDTQETQETQDTVKANGYNGLVLKGKFIPEELLTEILHYVDRETLLACQFVCKKWLLIIQKTNFGRNLIKNVANFKSYWNVVGANESGNTDWKIEITLVNTPPYPKDTKNKKINMCYVPIRNNCWKYQTIDLIEEGFTECLLDEMQPTVKVSDWYTCEWGGWALYRCLVELILERDDGNEIVKKEFQEVLKDNQNKWFKFEHEFTNYGKGLRKIKFSHGGEIEGNYYRKYGDELTHKCKIAGTCVTLEFPENYENEEEEN